MTGRHSLTRNTSEFGGEVWTASAPASAGCGRFVGRVGALAVALGVGVAVASGGTGVAWAEDGDGAGGGDTSNSDTSGGGAGNDNSDNGDGDDDGDAGADRDSAGTGASNTTQAGAQTKAPRRVLGPAWRRPGVRAPRVLLRAPGGTQTFTTTRKNITTPDGVAADSTTPVHHWHPGPGADGDRRGHPLDRPANPSLHRHQAHFGYRADATAGHHSRGCGRAASHRDGHRPGRRSGCCAAEPLRRNGFA